MAVSGIGGGLDVNQLVSQLVAAERAPGDRRFARLESTARADLSAFGILRSSLSGVESTLKKFTGSGADLGRRTVLDEKAGFTATSSSTASLGKYQISVERLATAHRLQSASAAKDAQIGHGTLSIQVGSGTAVDISIAEGSGTLADIAAAINTAGSGKGFNATVVSGDAGDVLMLTSTQVGSAGALTVTSSGGDGGLSVLQSTGGTMTQTAAAQDAQVRINGILRTATSNTISDAITGVTLNLTKEAAGTTFDLEVASDASTLKASLLGFVSAYNTAMTQLRTQSAAGGEGKTAGALSGDAAPRSISAGLRGAISSNYAALAELGLKTAVDGSLSLDGSTFDTAIAKDPNALKRLLGDDGALGKSLRTTLTSYVGDKGLIDGRTSSLNNQIKSLATQRDNFELRISAIEANYRRQFVALDSMMAQMQNTSNFLSQQLAGLA